jgi:hypothetical protein
MRVTLKNINTEAAKHGLELVKGDGYFYWTSNDDNNLIWQVSETMILAHKLTSLSWEGWMSELEDIVWEMRQLEN